MYKFEVIVKGLPICDVVIAENAEHAKTIFCRKRGLTYIDKSRLSARRVA